MSPDGPPGCLHLVQRLASALLSNLHTGHFHGAICHFPGSLLPWCDRSAAAALSSKVFESTLPLQRRFPRTSAASTFLEKERLRRALLCHAGDRSRHAVCVSGGSAFRGYGKTPANSQQPRIKNRSSQTLQTHTQTHPHTHTHTLKHSHTHTHAHTHTHTHRHTHTHSHI